MLARWRRFQLSKLPQVRQCWIGTLAFINRHLEQHPAFTRGNLER
jgi:hypothetical protein